MKQLLSVLIFLLLQLPMYGVSTSVYMSMGSSTFHRNYSPSLSVNAGISLINTAGFGYRFNAGYLETDSGSAPNLKLVPIEAELIYMMNPRAAFSTYIAGGLNVNILNDPFDSPGMGHHLRGGLMYLLAPETRVILDFKQQNYIDKQTDISINPFTISAGLLINLNGSTPAPQIQTMPNVPLRQKSAPRPPARRPYY